MKIVIVLALIAGTATGVVVGRAAGAAGSQQATPAWTRPMSDVGTGETLLVVIAGEFATEVEAERANARLAFGELRGFVVAPTSDFSSLEPGRYALVSAFRTVAGAAEFERVARSAGARSLRRVITRYSGLRWIGLGQEAHPDGSGPLNGPLPSGHPARIG